ncbi:MAG: GNAT family N-acetyltransferase [Acidobacteriota bacterium]
MPDSPSQGPLEQSPQGQSPEEIVVRQEEPEGSRRGRFAVYVDGVEAGEMTYFRRKPELIVIDHTGVPKEYGGRGLGQRLVAAAVEATRAAGHKIRPLCPFVRAVMKRTEAYHDVLEAPLT